MEKLVNCAIVIVVFTEIAMGIESKNTSSPTPFTRANKWVIQSAVTGTQCLGRDVPVEMLFLRL